jgi:hypothetical protein
MELVPIIAIAVVGAVGFCLMLAAFIMVSRRGGWQLAMQPSPQGRWPAPRRLMLIGAVLGAAFGLLTFVPGVVPWWEHSSPYDAWGLGVVFGLGLGFALGIVCAQTFRASGERPGGADRGLQA